MNTDLPTKCNLGDISQTYLRVLPTKWRQKSTGIDMKRLLRHCHSMYSRPLNWNRLDWSWGFISHLTEDSSFHFRKSLNNSSRSHSYLHGIDHQRHKPEQDVVAHTLLDTSHLLCCEFSHYGAISQRIFTADQFSGPGKAIGHVRVFVTVLPGIIAMQLCKVPLQRLRDSVI